eukprot:Rhum_TRINITY_DN3581_c0_g1::Rhum_TRINITY_DN3581_c0_g1_i1::g.11348::m.11348
MSDDVPAEVPPLAEVPETPAGDAEAEAAAEEAGLARQGSKVGEISHSPLNMKEARKKFLEEAAGEESAAAPVRKGSMKMTGPKPNKKGQYTYADLKMPDSKLTKEQIDVTIRESYLGDEEFEEVLGVSKKEWESMPVWKKEQKKKAVKLF